MAFRKSADAEITAETPELLFAVLPRTGKNSPSLWTQQTDLFREYMKHGQDEADIALELPTGTGKTLTGLMIADWRRRQFGARAIFACPTRQLVKQVVAAAKREGIPAVDLSGRWDLCNPADKLAYQSNRAIAVVAYSGIFNTSPKLAEADVILLDDAHAGEQYVSQSYTVNIPRSKYAAIHSAALEALRPGLEDDRYNNLIQLEPGPGVRERIDAHVLALRDDWTLPLGQALRLFEDEDPHDREATSQKFAYKAISSNLAACIAYVSWSKIEVRPVTPPTFDNTIFTNAKQRIYLSATLGAAGELERAFGRQKITRIKRPPEAAIPKSGRRFVVFPTYVDGADADALSAKMMAKAARAVVIAPSTSTLTRAAALVPAGWTTMKSKQVENTLEPFTEATDTALLLTNRYDGIDLPGEACRVIALYGYPGMTNLQERFYSSRAKAPAAIAERVRTRVVQGTGRCTRGNQDWALVIIADTDTASYLARPEVQATLDADLQAEIKFGLAQSTTSSVEMLSNVDAFLAQNDDWHDNAEPEIRRYRTEVERKDPASAPALAAAAAYEVTALHAAWSSNWSGASTAMNEAAQELDHDEDLKGYQASLLFYAAVFLEKARRTTSDETLVVRADALATAAVQAAGVGHGSWMNSSLPFAGRSAPPISSVLDDAAKRLVKLLGKIGNNQQLQERMSAMRSGLREADPKVHEPALSELGLLLGADALKPAGDARADSVWCWGNHLWITIEAKSRQKGDGSIGADDIRQTNHHLQYLAHDRGIAAAPSGSVSVITSASEAFDTNAQVIPGPHLYKVNLKLVNGLAADVDRMWKELHTLRNVDAGERYATVVSALRSHHLTPEDVYDRLTVRSIAPGA